MNISNRFVTLSSIALVGFAVAQGCGSSDSTPPAADGSSGTAGTSAAGTSAAGTSAAGTSAAGTSSGGTGGSTGGSVCQDYCGKVMTNCTADKAQYASMATCLAYCADLPVGTPGDMSKNTANCRDYHAGAAAMDATLHCPHAGPSGAGTCGGDCESFCSAALVACPSAFPSAAACTTACSGFSNSMTTTYNDSMTSGNSFDCRQYHLTAATTDPTTHCPHIVENSAVCK